VITPVHPLSEPCAHDDLLRPCVCARVVHEHSKSGASIRPAPHFSMPTADAHSVDGTNCIVRASSLHSLCAAQVVWLRCGVQDFVTMHALRARRERALLLVRGRSSYKIHLVVRVFCSTVLAASQLTLPVAHHLNTDQQSTGPSNHWVSYWAFRQWLGQATSSVHLSESGWAVSCHRMTLSVLSDSCGRRVRVVTSRLWIGNVGYYIHLASYA